eukprot:scaffold651264_cov46-Prasinocladus_malaysianus.AAC.1
MHRLAGLSLLTSLRILDVDGSTDVCLEDMMEMSAMARLECLSLRNSCYVLAQHLGHLQGLTNLTSLDFSLHGDYVDIARGTGEMVQPES